MTSTFANILRCACVPIGVPLLWACGGSEPPPPEPASTEEMVGWIQENFERGIRRPGFEADDAAAQWSVERFTELGLEDVTMEPIEVSRWEEGSDCSLEILTGSGTETFDCFAVPFSTPTSGLEGELVLDAYDLTRDTSEFGGRIVVYDNSHTLLPTSLMRDSIATATYDPDGVFSELTHVLPFGSRFLDVMQPAQEGGAIGFIGISRQSWNSNRYYVPYDAGDWALPGVWIDATDGNRLLELLEAGTVSARMSYSATRETVTSHNVTGVLPSSRSDEYVVIGSHHDGPWQSAVEDASGMALVVAQAHYWSQVPESDRPFDLLFLMNGGHMSGGAGIQHFVDAERDRLGRIVLALHLEHVARQHVLEAGAAVPTADPAPRWWFTSRIAPLEDALELALEEHDLRRSFVLRPDALGNRPPTDGAFLYPDVPVLQLLSAPEYLFAPIDTMEMIHEPSLVPITLAVVDVIMALEDQTAATMRDLERRPIEADPPPHPIRCEAPGPGACQNDADCAIINARPVDEIAGSCAFSCASAADQLACIESCISENAGIGSECGACYVSEILCTFTRCIGECAAGRENDICERCRVQQMCYENLLSCGGLTGGG